MEPLKMDTCACEQPKPISTPHADTTGLPRLLTILALALAGWVLVYSQLLPFSKFLVFSVLGLEPSSHLGKAVQFFVYDTPKVLLLLTLAVFVIGLVRSFVTVAWTRKVLAGRRESAGNVLAALLGVVTPFCSCSAVPLFIGFMTANVPLGVTFSFLIAAPMVNEIALIMLYGLLGWKIAALYFVTGVTLATVAGWVIGRMKMESHIEDWVSKIRAGEEDLDTSDLTWAGRIRFALDSVKDIVGRVWKYVLVGIAAGAAIHGYVPEGFMAQVMGKGDWWAVPVSVIVGIPMYTNAAGMIPIVEALLAKGAALGTVLAFMMSVIALSFPEMVILRKVLRPRLITVFIAVLGSGILLVGYLFNLVV